MTDDNIALRALLEKGSDAGFLQRFPDRFPLPVHIVLTDNGCGLTDRFAVDKKGEPHDKPSGAHPFDLSCAARAIAHRLTRPFRHKPAA